MRGSLRSLANESKECAPGEEDAKREKPREVVSWRNYRSPSDETGRVVPPFSPSGASEIGGFSDGVPTSGTLPSPPFSSVRRRFVNREVEERVLGMGEGGTVRDDKIEMRR